MAQATSTVTANVTLTDNGGNPIASQPVTVQYTPSAGGAPVNLGTGSVTTDANGKGTLTGTVPAPDTDDFTIAFAGVPNKYKPSSFVAKAVAIVAGSSVTATITVS